MSDGTISIDVELDEGALQASLDNMGKIVENGAALMMGSMERLGGSFRILPENIDTAFGGVPGLISDAIARIASRKSDMAATGGELFGSLAANMPAVVSNIKGRVGEINDGIASRLTGFFPEVSSTGQGLFSALVTNLPEAAATIVGRMPEISGRVIDKFTSFFPEIGSTGRSLFGSLTDQLPEAIGGINAEVPRISLGISDTLGNGRELIKAAGFGMFTALTGRLPAALELIAQAPVEITEHIISGFTALLSRFSDIGISMVEGVWAGISSMGGWLASQVSNFFSGIVGGITGFLGISSPSRLFKDKIGRNMALGVGAGLAAEMPRVANEMAGYVSAVVRSAERAAGGINIAAGYAFGPRVAAGAASADFKAAMGHSAAPPAVTVVLEPEGDMRGFFEYLSVNIKRVEYLGGEQL